MKFLLINLSVFCSVQFLDAQITDLNGQKYKTILIGEQLWLAENLNTSNFRNGDAIFHAKSMKKWIRAGEKGKPAWCYYNNDPANGTKYGKLYNWYALNDSRGLAPVGCHIPTDIEWLKTIDNLGREDQAGTKMKNSTGWIENGNGTNSSGFSGIPGGCRGLDGTFGSLGEEAIWWGGIEFGGQNVSNYVLRFGQDNISKNDVGGGEGFGFYVRCLLN
jgi:uncharacterized protein (TIGR02145 family)